MTVEEISCRDNAGRKVRAVCFRFMTTEETESGLRDRPGALGWKTATGETVKLIDQNFYEVFSSGELLERIS